MKLKTFLKVFALSVLTTSHLTLLVTFWGAWQNHYEITIYINRYYEAIPELILLVITIPMIIYVFNDMLNKWVEEDVSVSR